MNLTEIIQEIDILSHCTSKGYSILTEKQVLDALMKIHTQASLAVFILDRMKRGLGPGDPHQCPDKLGLECCGHLNNCKKKN